MQVRCWLQQGGTRTSLVGVGAGVKPVAAPVKHERGLMKQLNPVQVAMLLLLAQSCFSLCWDPGQGMKGAVRTTCRTPL